MPSTRNIQDQNDSIPTSGKRPSRAIQSHDYADFKVLHAGISWRLGCVLTTCHWGNQVLRESQHGFHAKLSYAREGGNETFGFDVAEDDWRCVFKGSQLCDQVPDSLSTSS